MASSELQQTNSQKKRNKDVVVKRLHGRESRVNGGRENLDCDEGIKTAYGSFERRQVRIVIWEDSEIPWFYSQTNTCGDVLL